MPELNDIKRGMDIGRKGSVNNFIWLACKKCGMERWVCKSRAQKPTTTGLCLKCSGEVGYYSLGGSDHPNWKGGRTYCNGYVLVRVEKDDFFYPMAQQIHKVMEHRLVMARHLGRCLEPWEIVHHKNGIKDDNRLANLELLPSRSFHLVETRTKCYIKELEAKSKKLEADILSGLECKR